MTITPKQLTITDPTVVKEKVYDGSTTAQVRAGALEGVETGDEVCVSATAGYDSEDVGTGKKITVKYTIEGADKGNYLSPVDTEIMDGTITPKQSARLTDSKTRMVYKVTKFGTTSGTVQFVKTGNTTVQTVTIPDTVTINGITYQVTSISAEAFKGYKKLEKVTMGKNVTEIGASAFYGCTKLDTVSMGAKVATISDKAFYKCTALKAITIPATVNKIGKQAFYGCKKLKTVTIKTTKLSSGKVGSKAFTGIYAKATVKVPKSKYKDYKKLLKAKGLGAKASVEK